MVDGDGGEELGSLRPWFERQFIEAFALVGRIGRKRFSRMEIEKRDFTLAEAATELGVNPKGLSRFAKHFGIGHTPWKDVHSFSKDDVEALRLKLADLITLPETIQITGVPGHEFRFLERRGGEAAKLTSLQQASISELVAMGVIQRLNGSPRLSEASVREFHANYMNAALLADELVCAPSWVKRRLRRLGVTFAFEFRTNTIIARGGRW